MSPTHTQPPPSPEAAALVLTAHLEWSWLALKLNVFPGFICLMSRTFHPSEQSEGRIPVERTQNWTSRSDWRVGATQAWYRSNQRQREWWWREYNIISYKGGLPMTHGTNCVRQVIPLWNEAPLAKLMKLVPSAEVKVTLRLDTVWVGGETWPFRMLLLQMAASAGTRDARDSGMSQSYTLGWLIWSCSPVCIRQRDETILTRLDRFLHIYLPGNALK